MARQNGSSSGSQKPRKKVYDSPEARENYMIGLSMDCAEQKLLDGTASAQIIVHFLKLGTKRAEIELEKMAMEKEMIRAKTELIDAEKNNGELYLNAIKAMGLYSGKPQETSDEEDV